MISLRKIACVLAVAYPVDLYAIESLDVKNQQGDLVISIKSGDFGSGPNTVIHDDFDLGTTGQPLENWNLSASAGAQTPSYSDATSITGKQSGMASFLGGNYNSSAEYKNLPELDTVYLSYYFKIDHLSGDLSRNIKLARLSGGHDSGTYNQAIGITLYDVHATGQILQASVDYSESKIKAIWTSDYSDNEWHRAEMYIKLSSPAKTANGITLVRIDGHTAMNYVNVVNEETGMRYKWLTLPYYVAHDAGGDYKIYYDNVVLSKNRARVELCESDVYADCKRPVVAKVTSWSPTSITLLETSLIDQKPYIYVFNENDTIVAKGRYCHLCPVME